MTLSKTFSAKMALAPLGNFLMSAAFLRAPAIAFPTANITLLAQENRHFEFEDFEFWVDQCLLLSQDDDHQKTLESCEQAISIRPGDNNIDLWTARSTALFNLEQYAEAIASFNRALRAALRDSISLAYERTAYVQLNQYYVTSSRNHCQRCSTGIKSGL